MSVINSDSHQNVAYYRKADTLKSNFAYPMVPIIGEVLIKLFHMKLC